MATGRELVRPQHVDAGTGELQPVPQFPHDPDETPLSLRDHTWLGVLKCNKQQDQILRREPNQKREVDILPSGELYMPQVFVRRRLNDAFLQHGGWKLRPMSKVSIDPETQVMYREYALIVGGIAVAAAYGANKYQPKNKRMDFADCAEAVRSNALTRCAKDLGIGAEMWERDWCDAWREKYAVHVWVNVKTYDYEANRNVEKKEHHWRKISRKPFYGEFGIVPDSPNFDQWHKQFRAHQKLMKERGGKVQEEAAGGKADRPATQAGGESSSARARETPRSSTDQNGVSPSLNVKPEERKHYIRRVAASKDQRKPHQIEMMDGSLFFTYHKTTLDAMQEIWAKRQRVEIDFETKVSNNRAYQHIAEWRVG
jgi:hypothetical protein